MLNERTAAMADRRKTLDELEGRAWGPATPSDTRLVKTCHGLRSKRISDFSVEDLRIMIGQKIGLPFLLPLALDILEREPLAEGDFYPGDLLHSLLTVDSTFWAAQPESRDRLCGIVGTLSAIPKELLRDVSLFKEACGITTA